MIFFLFFLTFLFNNQTKDNLFYTFCSAIPLWTAYEVITFWAFANQVIPYVSWEAYPIYCCFMFFLVPFIRDRTGKSARISEKIKKKIGIDLETKIQEVAEEKVAAPVAAEIKKEESKSAKAPKVDAKPKTEAPKVEAKKEETKPQTKDEPKKEEEPKK